MSAKAGTYVLVLRCHTRKTVQIGRRGVLDLEPGYYLYIGSAFGPGGIDARVARHWRKEKRRHWHIDYLRDHATAHASWISTQPKKLEHRWAHAIRLLPGIRAESGFGCSDCNCASHLFYCSDEPLYDHFKTILEGNLAQWIPTGSL
jgi:Uri superfamily endonuclease